ncbi:Glycosyltransferase involved in cell wall bisynthesis [Sphingomonas palmae]|uniref:Glycosyltransferase involved in cell wall bisynthesis n=1 Tax=Sphingomonas palmae TaxID=1855283 RepID=A0A1H7V050_9SPHN|nr:glycosyltransferase [Sphingomonas palmae]SEM02275.1 Glycosyltransferase involved in cell wall bisynthesis [Sphingomonas palmae]
MSSTKNCVIAHDYLTQKGGAERVTLDMVKAFNPELIITSVWNENSTFNEFMDYSIKESFLKHFKVFRRDPRFALPLLPFAWRFMKKIDSGVVLCSSSGWSHAIRTSSRTKKIVYCHNPARWIYQDQDYFLKSGKLVKALWALAKRPLRFLDKIAARSADCYVANSTSVAARIRHAYGIEARVVFPPVSIDVHAPREPVVALEPGYFLVVSRSRGYKGTQTIIDAFCQLPDHRLVIIGGDNFGNFSPNIRSLGHVSDAQLRWLYAHAVALVSLSREDFGLTPIEANAFGTPALVLRAGGFLDTTQEGTSGLFVDEATVPALVRAVADFPDHWDKKRIAANAERFSLNAFTANLSAIIDDVIGRKGST